MPKRLGLKASRRACEVVEDVSGFGCGAEELVKDDADGDLAAVFAAEIAA